MFSYIWNHILELVEMYTKYTKYINPKKIGMYERMKSYIMQDSTTFTSGKGHIISIKCSNILHNLNKLDSISNKIQQIEAHNKILTSVCKELYKKLDPYIIYAFNNEIHLLFFSTGNDIYSGNKYSKVSLCASLATAYLSDMFKRQIICTGYQVEFSKKFEILNYLIWRQYDCKRNICNLLYKCVTQNTGPELPKLDVVENELNQQSLCDDNEISRINEIKYGIVMKKQFKTYLNNYKNNYTRKGIVWASDSDLVLDSDFDKVLGNLISNKILSEKLN